MDIDYGIASYILRGKRRKMVLESLAECPKTPKQITGEIKVSISNVSVTLSELAKEGFVERKTPDAHTYRFYALTEKGRKAMSGIKRANLLRQ